MYAHTWKMSIYILKYSIVSYLHTSRKHCIEQEKQWDFLKELTAKVSQVGAEEQGEESSAPKKGRCVQISSIRERVWYVLLVEDVTDSWTLAIIGCYCDRMSAKQPCYENPGC